MSLYNYRGKYEQVLFRQRYKFRNLIGRTHGLGKMPKSLNEILLTVARSSLEIYHSLAFFFQIGGGWTCFIRRIIDSILLDSKHTRTTHETLSFFMVEAIVIVIKCPNK